MISIVNKTIGLTCYLDFYNGDELVGTFSEINAHSLESNNKRTGNAKSGSFALASETINKLDLNLRPWGIPRLGANPKQETWYWQGNLWIRDSPIQWFDSIEDPGVPPWTPRVIGFNP